MASLDIEQLFDNLDVLLGYLLVICFGAKGFGLGLPSLVILANFYGPLTCAVGESRVNKRSQAILSYR